MSSYEARFEQAKRDPNRETVLLALLRQKQQQNEENAKTKENIINYLAEIYVELKQPEKIKQILLENQDAFNIFSKPRAAKITKNLIDYVAQIPNSEQLQIELCKYLIKWCIEQKRTPLKHRIELRLASLYLSINRPTDALDIIDPILTEVRKADDKHLLVELHLLESKIFFHIKNYAKAKASLTASRAASNAVYVQPLLTADIDMMSGILYSQDKDFKTAYSYFFEAFECLNSHNDPKAVKAFKYMILCKIMRNAKDEINQLINGKYGLKYGSDPQVLAIKQVSDANAKQSIVALRDVLQSHPQIESDEVLYTHIRSLYDSLLEKNLNKVIESYTRVELSHISHKIKLDEATVERKLSQMQVLTQGRILDKKIQGTLDQANHCLILYHDLPVDDLYPNSEKLMANLDVVIDKLFERSLQLKKV